MKRKVTRWFFIFLCLLASLSKAQVNSGYATNYTELGSPYGGCGVPQDLLETQNFVALNVYNSPGNYTAFGHPVTGSNLKYLGEFDNGLNCGRWVKVTIGANCQGTNDGAQNQAFCRGAGAKWVDDNYSGATLYMIVADACPDANAWCRDSPYHLDMVQSSLNLFEKNGKAVGDMYPKSWNNREITWEYVEAPDYSGDINLYFLKGSQRYYAAIMINNLPNGIHGVEQKVGNQWVKATMNSDLGQSYILPTPDVTSYTIRIYDADDQLLNQGRQYVFSLPTACGGNCTPAATATSYQTIDIVTDLEDVYQVADNVYFTVEDGLLIGHKRDMAYTNELDFTVLDTQGKIIAENGQIDPGHQAFALARVQKGMYIVVMKSQGGQTFAKRVLY